MAYPYYLDAAKKNFLENTAASAEGTQERASEGGREGGRESLLDGFLHFQRGRRVAGKALKVITL
jgi:hypothetical protein